jgi:hypothetical protein
MHIALAIFCIATYVLYRSGGTLIGEVELRDSSYRRAATLGPKNWSNKKFHL